MKKIFWIIGIIIIFVTVSLTVSNSIIGFTVRDREAVKVRMGNLPVINGLPLYYALEKGYFKEAGIELELTKFESPNQIIDALLQDRIDFSSTSGAMGITGVADYKNPGKLKIYAATGGSIETPNEILLIPVDSNLTSIQDLRGKKLGILGGTIQWRTITRHVLAENGMDMDKDVTIVELAPSFQIQALASKQINALLALEPIPTVIKEKNIGKELIRGPAELTIANPLYVGAGIVRVGFAQENPETTQKVLEIFRKAIKDINEDPDSARQYLKGYTPLDDSTISKAPLPLMKMCEDLTKNDAEAIEKFYDIFTLYKVVDGDIDFRNLAFCRVE